MYQSIHSLNSANFYEKKLSLFFLLEVKTYLVMLKNQSYNALYNANLHRLTCKMSLLQKVKKKKKEKKKKAFFFSLNSYMVLQSK